MKSNKECWQEVLERYRASKKIREIRKKLHINQSEIGRLTGFTKQYVNNVQEMTIKPSEDFLKKLEEVKNGI
ncbi:MAG: helix-turn-helix domain-containing protein [Candidatus Humimicrobiaceae bacterium]